MKRASISLAILLACSFIANAADTSAKISGVHLCCKSCVTGVEKAVQTVPDAKAEVDKDAGTVTLSGPDRATVQKAADAMVKAGYFGASSEPGIKMDASTGAKDAKVQKLQVNGVHLCCPKCVKAVDTALKSVDGVKENNATKG